VEAEIVDLQNNVSKQKDAACWHFKGQSSQKQETPF
jgi:hypothetical protein